MSDLFEEMFGDLKKEMEKEVDEQMDMIAGQAGFPKKSFLMLSGVMFFRKDAGESPEFEAEANALAKTFLANMFTLAKKHFGANNVMTPDEIGELMKVGMQAMHAARGAEAPSFVDEENEETSEAL